jgi:hypothetical protein
MGFWKTFTDGYSWRLYERAYGRIWSGRFLFVLWLIIWCTISAYFGFWLFDFDLPMKLEIATESIARYGFLGITPMIVGWALVRSYVNEGTGDSFLKTVPLRPHQALMPRMIAVFLIWIEFALPFVFLYWMLTVKSVAHMAIMMPPPRMQALTAYTFMDDRIMAALWLILPFGVGPTIVPNMQFITVSDLPLLYSLITLEVIGFGLLPIAWGFWWGTRFKRRGGLFLLAYFSYIIFSALLWFEMKFDLFGIFIGFPNNVWATIVLASLGWTILAVLFTFLTFREWIRRPD